mmetsp:Transcript_20635/g.53621  ORF Transcript_20635/g.53621 Transcript_20635/m.53621 type:complete len:203 (+) Transcript_20635:373-981(+)
MGTRANQREMRGAKRKGAPASGCPGCAQRPIIPHHCEPRALPIKSKVLQDRPAVSGARVQDPGQLPFNQYAVLLTVRLTSTSTSTRLQRRGCWCTGQSDHGVRELRREPQARPSPPNATRRSFHPVGSGVWAAAPMQNPMHTRTRRRFDKGGRCHGPPRPRCHGRRTMGANRWPLQVRTLQCVRRQGVGDTDAFERRVFGGR